MKKSPLPTVMNPRLASAAWDSLSDAVYLIRQDGSLAYVNPTACKMLGYTSEELLSKRMFDINPELSAERWPTIWSALAEQKHRRFSSYHEARNGRRIDVEISANMVELDGQQYSCALARDIAAKLEADRHHQREHAFITGLIDTAPVMIVVLDANGKIIRFNRTAEKLSGYRHGDLQEKSWLQDLSVQSDEYTKMKQSLLRVMEGETIQAFSCGLQTKSGELKEILWHLQLLGATEKEEEPSLLLIGQDISEQRKLEENLRQSEKLQAIGRLAGGIAHDFNNQLAGIMGWAEILSWESEAYPTLHQMVERIIQASERAKELTSQLLAYARKSPGVAKNVDMNKLIQEASTMLQRGTDKNISLAYELDADDANVQGDPTQLANAILNVAINAQDAMSEGGKLTFSTRLIPPESVPEVDTLEPPMPEEYVEIGIRDTGCGMDDAVIRHIFEPFFTTKQEGRGTGLGMAATYGAVKSHRGAISVDSEPGQGTQFKIYLPHVPAGSKLISMAPIPIEQPTMSLRVMVVDDEEAVREVLIRFLRQLKCEAVSFDNGFDAIDHFSQSRHEIDVVLLDLVMPMLDGKSTFYALRRIDPSVPVILISGYTMDGQVQTLLDDGAHGFIAKPFTLKAVADTLARAVPSSLHTQPVSEHRPVNKV